MATWGCFSDALAAFGTAITPGHICGDTTFVQEDEAISRDSGNLLSPGISLFFAALGVLFSGVQTFFSCSVPFPAELRTISEH